MMMRIDGGEEIQITSEPRIVSCIVSCSTRQLHLHTCEKIGIPTVWGGLKGDDHKTSRAITKS